MTVPVDIERLLEEFAEAWPLSPWGPAHILIEDYNIDDASLAAVRGWVIAESSPEYEAERAATLELLDVIAAIPERERKIPGYW